MMCSLRGIAPAISKRNDARRCGSPPVAKSHSRRRRSNGPRRSAREVGPVCSSHVPREESIPENGSRAAARASQQF